MASSTIPTAKAGILTLLAARPALASVQRVWAHPGQLIEKESIFFLEALEEESPAAIGQLKREENYTIDLLVSVLQDGDDAKACEERAWALVAEVETALRAEPKPAAGVLWATVSAKRLNNFPGPESRTSEITVVISVKARI